MSLASRLRHQVAILRSTPGEEDEGGNPTLTWTVLATVRARVQPRPLRDAVRELTDPTEGGTVVSDHTILLMPTDVRAADVIRFVPDDGRLFRILGVRDAGGKGHHLELDARVVS